MEQALPNQEAAKLLRTTATKVPPYRLNIQAAILTFARLLDTAGDARIKLDKALLVIFPASLPVKNLMSSWRYMKYQVNKQLRELAEPIQIRSTPTTLPAQYREVWAASYEPEDVLSPKEDVLPLKEDILPPLKGVTANDFAISLLEKWQASLIRQIENMPANSVLTVLRLPSNRENQKIRLRISAISVLEKLQE